MNTHAPPGKRAGALLHAPDAKLGLIGPYHARDSVQAGIVWAVWAAWQREAARLFGEYWRTGNQKHLRAFVRHVHAMRVHEERRLWRSAASP
jgi:hypothetical protein